MAIELRKATQICAVVGPWAAQNTTQVCCHYLAPTLHPPHVWIPTSNGERSNESDRKQIVGRSLAAQSKRAQARAANKRHQSGGRGAQHTLKVGQEKYVPEANSKVKSGVVRGKKYGSTSRARLRQQRQQPPANIRSFDEESWRAKATKAQKNFYSSAQLHLARGACPGGVRGEGACGWCALELALGPVRRRIQLGRHPVSGRRRAVGGQGGVEIWRRRERKEPGSTIPQCTT